jgi:CheY-like chemotaxis protein
MSQVNRGTILIVDDMEVNRLLARAYLEMLGWKVDECNSGFSALNYLRKSTPEYALIDIRMPDIDGFALAKEIRSTHPLGTVKIVAYTAYTQTEAEVYMRDFIFDKILFKPMLFEDVMSVFGTKDQEIFSWENTI